jgi:hypothetical protein
MVRDPEPQTQLFAVIYYPFLSAPQQSPAFANATQANAWAQANLPLGMIWHVVNVVAQA